MKYVFIVNPKAGKGTGAKTIPSIEKVCKRRNLDFEIRESSEEKSTYDIAIEYKDSENIIYVVGGDGTISVTLPAFVGTKNRLGIIPAGSGNDTYKAIRGLKKGETEIDIAKINDMYFINVACIGIDAEVANNLDKFKKSIVPKSQLYTASIIYTFFKFKYKNLKMKTSVKTIEDKYTILSVCNGVYYGGGYKIAPKSQLTDGLLDIYYAEKISKLRILPLLLKLKKGLHEGKRKIHKFRTNHVEIELEEPVTFNVDGEKLTDTKFIIDVIQKEIIAYNDDELVKEITSLNAQTKK